MDSSLEPLERKAVLPTPDFSLEDLHQTSDLQDAEIYLYCFKPLNLW